MSRSAGLRGAVGAVLGGASALIGAHLGAFARGRIDDDAPVANAIAGAIEDGVGVALGRLALAR